MTPTDPEGEFTYAGSTYYDRLWDFSKREFLKGEVTSNKYILLYWISISYNLIHLQMQLWQQLVAVISHFPTWGHNQYVTLLHLDCMSTIRYDSLLL